MSTPSWQDVTQLLLAWSQGEQTALEKLTPLVYEELHRLAHHYMGRERPNHTLQTATLVNEVYVRLMDCSRVRWQNRPPPPGHLGPTDAAFLKEACAADEALRQEVESLLAQQEEAESFIEV